MRGNAEQVAVLAAAISKAKSKLEYAQLQLACTTTLARSGFASLQALDQATNDVASARADVAEAEANHAAAPPAPRARKGASPMFRCRPRRRRSACSSGI